MALAGTPDEGDTAKSLLIKHARQPEKAALFNYASMAHNNHFFFSGIASPSDCRDIHKLTWTVTFSRANPGQTPKHPR